MNPLNPLQPKDVPNELCGKTVEPKLDGMIDDPKLVLGTVKPELKVDGMTDVPKPLEPNPTELNDVPVFTGTSEPMFT